MGADSDCQILSCRDFVKLYDANMSTRKGPANPNWRGGRIVDPRGYVLIRVGTDHPLADVRGYAYEHRLKAQEKTRKRLTTKNIVRHNNRKYGDNVDTNLTITDRLGLGIIRRKPHGKAKRMPGERNPIVKCVCGCGATFCRYDATRRPRRFISGHNLRVL